MTVTFETPMTEAICSACRGAGCRYEYRGELYDCPFKTTREGECEPGQFGPDEIRSLHNTIVMNNFYRKGKLLP